MRTHTRNLGQFRSFLWVRKKTQVFVCYMPGDCLTPRSNCLTWHSFININQKLHRYRGPSALARWLLVSVFPRKNLFLYSTCPSFCLFVCFLPPTSYTDVLHKESRSGPPLTHFSWKRSAVFPNCSLSIYHFPMHFKCLSQSSCAVCL